MPIKFGPVYTITSEIAQQLIEIEAYKQTIETLPLTVKTLTHLRETARLKTIHYSTQIEGNRLSQEEVKKVLTQQKNFPGRERDEQEVRGYYAALEFLNHCVANNKPVTEKIIQTLHALVMAHGKTRVKPSAYRTGQNVIRESHTNTIVYMPPEAKDVAPLMHSLVNWINKQKDTLPCPLLASIAHYQFVTIHPYFDGNGRTARLLTTLILHLGGYGLKGIYSLEEYYAKNLGDYYQALSVGPSHNYYFGRAEADITPWLSYFCEGMATSFRNIKREAVQASQRGEADQSPLLRSLDSRQRNALGLFTEFETVTAHQVGELFGLGTRGASALCQKWVQQGFLTIADPSRKARKYTLAQEYAKIIT
jgi:Fic family protein